jgi:serine acetyltransferase
MKLPHYLFGFVSRVVRHLTTKYHKNRFAEAGAGGCVGYGFKANYPQYVHLGSDVEINDYCWVSFAVDTQSDGRVLRKPKVLIGNRSYIGRFATIACMQEVTIGNDVLISDRVFIGDCYHGFDRADLPIKNQGVYSHGPVVLDDGAWIGIGVAILPNVHIGRNAVIGANSVVRCDVPDFHVAAGVPARIIRDLRQ